MYTYFKTSIVLALCLFLAGCGYALFQIREAPPTTVLEINKDTHCVHNVINSEIYNSPLSTGCIIDNLWQSSWNPFEKRGEIFAYSPLHSTCHVHFYIFEKEGETIIEMRHSPYSPWKFGKIGNDILTAADFSGCDDK